MKITLPPPATATSVKFGTVYYGHYGQKFPTAIDPDPIRFDMGGPFWVVNGPEDNDKDKLREAMDRIGASAKEENGEISSNPGKLLTVLLETAIYLSRLVERAVPLPRARRRKRPRPATRPAE